MKALQSAVRMNERCLELQKAKPSNKAARATAAAGNPSATKGATSKPVPKKAGSLRGGGGGCEYKKKVGAMRKLTDGILAQPMDIEELATQATSRSCCGYYAARAALPAAQLVRFSSVSSHIHIHPIRVMHMGCVTPRLISRRTTPSTQTLHVRLSARHRREDSVGVT